MANGRVGIDLRRKSAEDIFYDPSMTLDEKEGLLAEMLEGSENTFTDDELQAEARAYKESLGLGNRWREQMGV